MGVWEFQNLIRSIYKFHLHNQDKQVTKFHEKCRLQAFFPEKESQSRRQVDRIKIGCYFPEIQQEQDR